MDGTLRVKPAKPTRFDAVTGEFYMGWLPPGAGSSTPPELPAQADLNYRFKTDGDPFLLDFLRDRSPNGIPNPTVVTPGQRGAMIYPDLSVAAILPGDLNGKTAVQVGGQFRARVTTASGAPVYPPYFSVGSGFTTLTICKSAALSATNNYIIFPEIQGTPALVGNIALYAFYQGPGDVRLYITTDDSGTVVFEASISPTTFNSYSTVVWTYNGLGLTAANFSIKVNGVELTVTPSAFPIVTGNGGIFYGTGNDTDVPTGFLLESAMWNKALSSSELAELNAYTQNEYTLISA